MPTVLIIGSTGTLGNAVADLTLARGFKVFGAARRIVATRDYPCLHLDIKNEKSIMTLARQLPMIDLLVFAQGLQPSRSLKETSRKHIMEMLDTHVIGTLLCLRHLRPVLSRDGCVVLISSVAARKGSYDPAYAAAKGAILALTKSLCREWASQTRVNCVAPGLVEGSPVHRSMKKEHVKTHLSRMVTKSLIQPKHVAQAILAIYDNPSINGAVLSIDGGYQDS